MSTILRCLLGVWLFSASFAAVAAEPAATPDLKTAIAAQDAALFDAYNHCDLATLGHYFDKDVEFYDDRNGLAIGSQPLLDAVKKYICGKAERVLVPGSLEVYPIPGYGAVEMGVHRFLHPTEPDNPPGEGRFVNIWRLKDGAWQITRVISYAHAAAKP